MWSRSWFFYSLSDVGIEEMSTVVGDSLCGNSKSSNDIVADKVRYRSSMARLRAIASTHVV